MKSNVLLIKAIVFLVVGILLCVGVLDVNSFLAWVISASLMVCAAVFLVIGLTVEKSFVSQSGFTGAVLLAVGIALMPVENLNFFKYYAELISLIMMTIGSAYLLEGGIGFAYKKHIAYNISFLVIGAALFTLGILSWFNVGDIRKVASMILGIFFILYSGLHFYSYFTKKETLIIDFSDNTSKK